MLGGRGVCHVFVMYFTRSCGYTSSFIKQIQAAIEKREQFLWASAALPLPFWCWHKHSCGDVVSV